MKPVSILPFLIALFLFLFVPLKILQFAAAFFLLVYCGSFAVSLYMRSSLSVERARETLFCTNGSDEHSFFTVANKGLISMSRLIILDRATGCFCSGSGSFIAALPGKNSRTFSCPVITTVRGKYRTGPIRIKGADPLNFFPWEKVFPLFGSIVVYPRGHSLPLLLVEGERGGDVQSTDVLYEDPIQLKGIRDYRPGDPLKRINWKASARTGKLKTMEFSYTLDAPLLVLLDLTVPRYPLKHRHILLERAIEAAVSLIISYGEAKQKISLLVKGAEKPVFIPFGRGFGHVVTLLEELAQITFSREGSDESVIDFMMSRGIPVESGTHVSLLVPSLEGNLTAGMEILRRRRALLQLIATGGTLPPGIPASCRAFTLSEYGKEYFS
ncbi:MAG: DUF58 domain-containing protein [Spirochaetales bacterium]|nr:DUF58 domain-containing protein [Spirochaetales bacterium]